MRYLIVILLGGCSFAFVSGPPANHAQLPYFDCTQSRVAPILDTAFTVIQGLNVAVAASDSDAEWDNQFSGDPPISRTTAIGVYVGFAALGAAGMYYGYSKTADCRAAKQAWMMRGGMQQPMPGTWPPPVQQQPGPPAQTPQQPLPPQPPPMQPAPVAPAPPLSGGA